MDPSNNYPFSNFNNQPNLSQGNLNGFFSSSVYQLHFDESQQRDFTTDLKNLAITNKIPHFTLNSLLDILNFHKKHQNLPKDARVLLETPREKKTSNLWEMVHLFIWDWKIV